MHKWLQVVLRGPAMSSKNCDFGEVCGMILFYAWSLLWEFFGKGTAWFPFSGEWPLALWAVTCGLGGSCC